jgi:hypothetical protein
LCRGEAWAASSLAAHAVAHVGNNRRSHSEEIADLWRLEPGAEITPRPTVERGGGALAITAASASTACRSACNPSMMPICGIGAGCTVAEALAAIVFHEHSRVLLRSDLRAPSQDARGLGGRACTRPEARRPPPLALPAHHRAGRPTPSSTPARSCACRTTGGACLLRAAQDDGSGGAAGLRDLATTPRPARSAATTCSTGATPAMRGRRRRHGRAVIAPRAAPPLRSGSLSAGLPSSRPKGAASWRRRYSSLSNRPTRHC